MGPDFDPRDHTQLVVLGRARSVELGASTAVGYLEATVTLKVIRAFRGATPSPLRLVDRHSAFTELNPFTAEMSSGSLAVARWLLERHGVAVPFLITGAAPDVGVFGPALAP